MDRVDGDDQGRYAALVRISAKNRELFTDLRLNYPNTVSKDYLHCRKPPAVRCNTATIPQCAPAGALPRARGSKKQRMSPAIIRYASMR